MAFHGDHSINSTRQKRLRGITNPISCTMTKDATSTVTICMELLVQLQLEKTRMMSTALMVSMLMETYARASQQHLVIEFADEDFLCLCVT